MSNRWIFIIDTDKYAGNFERDMCAYVTGCIGDCCVGDDFAELFRKEMNVGKNDDSPFLDIVELVSDDDNGCRRPTSIWKTKGWLEVGHDKAVRKEDWNQEEANKTYQEEGAEIYRGYLKQVENAKVGEAGWTKESKDREIADYKKDIARAMKEKSPKCEPNNSVAIFFYEKPTQKQIDLMKERAAKFAKAKQKMAKAKKYSWDKDFSLTIYGFRLIKEVTKSESEEEV